MNCFLKEFIVNQESILETIEDKGVKIDYFGGQSNPSIASGCVVRNTITEDYTLYFDNCKKLNMYRPFVFFRTLKNIEKLFNYQLFG